MYNYSFRPVMIFNIKERKCDKLLTSCKFKTSGGYKYINIFPAQ